jgi:hypothetical protein
LLRFGFPPCFVWFYCCFSPWQFSLSLLSSSCSQQLR